MSEHGTDDDIFDGTAVITAGEFTTESRVRLIGFFNPLDGKFHWQGTIYAKPEGGGAQGRHAGHHRRG